MIRRLALGAVLLIGHTVSLPSPSFAADAFLPRIVANDNRTPAGVRKDGVLTLTLEIRRGEWYPEAEDGPHMAVNAFAEPGKKMLLPGPLIRVPEGTEIRVTLRNTLGEPMEVHGFYSRPGKDSLIALAAGEERTIHFLAGAPGTYYYYAFSPLELVAGDPGGDSQELGGALIVDAVGATSNDRIFVLNFWNHYINEEGKFDAEFGAINGKSWPYSERLTFPLGESAHWRVINLTPAVHPMHLHGAYYRVDARGNGEHADEQFAREQRPMVVTVNLPPGETMDMTWKPDHAGRWLFHCHILAHIDPEASLSAIQKLPQDHHAAVGMAGLVLAAEVTGGQQFKPVAYSAPRRLSLVISEAVPKESVKLELIEGSNKAASTALMGPPIILHRGEPTEIEVVNRLSQNTSIHWHGIELESYYDGVPDFSGAGNLTASAIAPGRSFVARMTPPRAGTFIYHTHWHDIDQLDSGLYGPLLVLEPGQKYQPEQDAVFVAGLTVKDVDGPLLINGSDHPEVAVRAGRVRLRLINITPNNTALRCTLLSAGKKAQWRKLAKDGMDLPEAQRTSGEAVQRVGVGETYDFEINAAAGDELVLEGYLPGPKIGTKAIIHVR